MSDKVFRMIGLAFRAGKIDAGEAKAEDRLRHGKSKLVIVSQDASENTVKKFENLCRAKGVRMIMLGSREVLGNYTGRPFAVTLSVSDEGFAKEITSLFGAVNI